MVCPRASLRVGRNAELAGVTIAASWGEALQLGVSLGIHREASYAGLGEYFFKCSSTATNVDAEMIDPISAEVQRRMFGLLFTSDKAA